MSLINLSSIVEEVLSGAIGINRNNWPELLALVWKTIVLSESFKFRGLKVDIYVKRYVENKVTGKCHS
jgi:hypothetical protein